MERGMDEAVNVKDYGEIYMKIFERGKQYAQRQTLAAMVEEYGAEQIREWIIEIMKEGKDNAP